MDEPKPAAPDIDAEVSADSLESPDTATTELTSTDATSGSVGDGKSESGKKASGGLKQKLRQFNLYLLLFIFILIIGGLIITIAYFQSQKASTSSTLKTQSLTQQTLKQVASSDATVGNAQQVLNVESSAVFAGKVLVREDLEVAGNLQIGGTVALTDLTVSGATAVGQLSVSKDLALTGNAAIQGSATIAKSLQVNGAGTFSGPLSAPQITTPSLQLNGDLVLTHHILAGGASPGRSNGPALGSGGTATVGGSDTSGSVTINTGSSPAAGCFITVSFTSNFASTPRVIVTPVGSAAGSLAYYVSRNTTSFSICDATAPPSGSSFGFDYFVVD